jgi:hypothetical protein
VTSVLARSGRRVAVSLTALVDLLFVILFAQFLQMQESKKLLADNAQAAEAARDAAEAESKAAEKRRDDAIEIKAGLLANVSQLTAQLAAAEKRAAQKDSELEQEQKRVQELEKQLGVAIKEGERTKEQAEQAQRELAATMSRMLSTVDAAMVAKTLESGATTEELKRVQDELEKVKDQTTAQAIQMIRRANEVQKRVDIWEVHLYRDGSVRLRSPGQGADAIERTLDTDNEDEFTNEFVRIATSHGTPKSLVLILYTHENAKGGMIRGVQAALEQVKIKWAADLGEKKVSVSSPSFTETEP